MPGTNYDFTIKKLGRCTVNSPLSFSTTQGDYVANYASDERGIIYNIQLPRGDINLDIKKHQLVEKAGPRQKIYFDPAKVNAAVVTCGGLCPGLNAVIRSITHTLFYSYGVKRLTGIQYGYRGFLPEFGLPTVNITPETVNDIHTKGGTILGSSRGHGDRVNEIVDAVERMNINMLFVIGGDGTQRGSLDISREAEKRNLNISVVGIPKTIDNDLSFIERSFGFETAVSKAIDAVAAAHIEAKDACMGVGLVKLMGRESGFIAAHTALASQDVNFVFVPEVPFKLNGENGFLKTLEERMKYKDHAVIVAAEGAGQELLKAEKDEDESGNKRLADIGLFLKESIEEHFSNKNWDINLKYIDPSYIIRSAPPNPNDTIYCSRLGANAVHGAMAGRTEFLISMIYNTYVHIPIPLATSKRNYIDPDGPLWRDVLSATGQPRLMQG
ncbi:ATP-dependent 6-phosphofructokinase [Sedimentisphaera salicampi]|uniref:ATP-dependent 6-phosphofructokinase n=1 Tax=Sedimentisphaera salicampi TaxID=1941349 RepID=UPI000B9B6A09|nr:ATP-dependent 6-phosphofructokinase [Sedimentisphaera salicampi]OXU15886.1 6-phosphofructokinase 1 [Sedimentisphaera salicampi]